PPRRAGWCPWAPSGEQREAAVDDEGLAAHHLGRVRAEEADRVGDVARLDQPACRGALQARADHLLAVREVLERARLDDACRDRVDADSPWRELDGEVAHDRLQR